MAQIRNDILLKKIAKRIKTLRHKKGAKQEEFYNDTGIHLGRIESIRSNISVSTLEVFCDYLGLTLQKFFKEI